MIANNSWWLLLCIFGTALYRHGGHGWTSPTKVPRSWTRNFQLKVASPNKLFVADQSEKVDDVATQERNLRFAGVGKLYATDSTPYLEVLDRLGASTVTVVGLGGVGSWAAESLCRSGIGRLILIDLDDICISNTNRQLHTTVSSVGKMKLDEMERRLKDINPHCNITLIHDFLSKDNVDDILDSCSNMNMTVMLDAMDGYREKTALLEACVKRSIPVVTCGAAAGRMDPTKITVCDLTKSTNDRLLSTCRKTLRRQYNFERCLSSSEAKRYKKRNRSWHLPAVFSLEVPKDVCQDDTSSFRRCDGPLGTGCFVTGTIGFVASGVVVEMIAQNKVNTPKRR